MHYSVFISSRMRHESRKFMFFFLSKAFLLFLIESESEKVIGRGMGTNQGFAICCGAVAVHLTPQD